MPEGPSIVILRELAADFAGKTIVRVEGNTKLDKARLLDRRIVSLRSWGKHLLIEFADFSVRIHFLLFGSYRINERKPSPARLSLGFGSGARQSELNFYACSVQFVEGRLEDTYDWRGDVMSDEWDAALAHKKLRAAPDTLVCDALLDQDVFAGVGNIIKNEVLFRIRVHPSSTVGALPAPKLREMVEEARQYSFDFLEWKKAFVLKQHWLAHRKTQCPRCDIPLRKATLGKTKRIAYYCAQCQRKYGDAPLVELPVAPRSRRGAAASPAAAEKQDGTGDLFETET